MRPSFYEAKRKLSNNRQKNSTKKILADRIEEYIKDENSSKEEIPRLTYEQREWIRIRDERRCQLKINGCRENTKTPIQVHHIVPWDYAYYKLNWPKEYIDAPENTITLCYTCHTMIHTNKVNINKMAINKIKWDFDTEQSPFENPCWLTAFDERLKGIAIQRTNDYLIKHPENPFPTT